MHGIVLPEAMEDVIMAFINPEVKHFCYPAAAQVFVMKRFHAEFYDKQIERDLKVFEDYLFDHMFPLACEKLYEEVSF